METVRFRGKPETLGSSRRAAGGGLLRRVFPFWGRRCFCVSLVWRVAAALVCRASPDNGSLFRFFGLRVYLFQTSGAVPLWRHSLGLFRLSRFAVPLRDRVCLCGNLSGSVGPAFPLPDAERIRRRGKIQRHGKPYNGQLAEMAVRTLGESDYLDTIHGTVLFPPAVLLVLPEGKQRGGIRNGKNDGLRLYDVHGQKPLQSGGRYVVRGRADQLLLCRAVFRDLCHQTVRCGRQLRL